MTAEVSVRWLEVGAQWSGGYDLNELPTVTVSFPNPVMMQGRGTHFSRLDWQAQRGPVLAQQGRSHFRYPVPRST